PCLRGEVQRVRPPPCLGRRVGGALRECRVCVHLKRSANERELRTSFGAPSISCLVRLTGRPGPRRRRIRPRRGSPRRGPCGPSPCSSPAPPPASPPT